MMEGTLWKWTNYFSGWQPRWFVLEDGILSYYKSQEDVDNGCKGSIKMAVCDVTVHPTDASRLDLIIPGEAHFYVKAATPQERQQWLVALGTSKAGLTNIQTHTAKDDVRADEGLKAKKSELRLYCDLLMQQVHSVKKAVTTEPGQPDIGQLDEATSLLSATCDTFITALDECMLMATSTPATPPAIPPSPSRKSPSSRSVPWSFSHPQRSVSLDSSGTPAPPSNRRSSSNSPEDSSIVRGYIPGRRGSRSSGGGGRNTASSAASVPPITENGTDHEHSTESPQAATVPDTLPQPPQLLNGASSPTYTFFTAMKTSFHDVDVGQNGNVPTEPFLEACRAILPIFDKLNPTAFAPVMYDISGNIKKLQQKFSTDPEGFAIVQNMVLYEVGAKQHQHSSSATLALLWLKRSLAFIVVFLDELIRGTEDLTVAATAAYTTTLKPYHNFVNRGAYALASKSIPSRGEFFHILCTSGGSGGDGGTEATQQCLREDMMQYVTHLRTVVDALHAFFQNNHLDSNEMV